MHQAITLNASRADAFYYPPDWDPSKGSLDAFQRKKGFEHHLGKSRVRQLNQGILVIRFEMPFHTRCLKCENRIAKGVRFNANKKKIGKYHTTSIWEFEMRCTTCANLFKIRTDPENAEYVMAEGLRKVQTDTWDAAEAGSMGELPDQETRGRMDVDPMFKLDYNSKKKVVPEKIRKSDLRELYAMSKDREDEYALNSSLRRTFRTMKKEEIAREAEEARPKNFSFPLAEEDPADAVEARRVQFTTDHAKVGAALRRQAKVAESIFVKKGQAKKVDLACKHRKLLLAQRIQARSKDAGAYY
mmetsp:Transcript_8474/g.18347  ORF Transcript_8474/g.18347 Transcript_8474/m.18347 type:complete len:301 (+) Transcript_8474:60-962(+)